MIVAEAHREVKRRLTSTGTMARSIPAWRRAARVTLALLLLPISATPAAVVCGTSGGTTLQTLSIPMLGHRSITRTITVLSGTEVLLTAAETGVDVRLQIQVGGETWSWDNPVRRWGPQRIILPAGPQRHVPVTVVA